MRCDHEHEDGAYVLGALSPAERTAYERHLATCSFCREAVADIAALPDLLSRLEPAEFDRWFDLGTQVPRQRSPHGSAAPAHALADDRAPAHSGRFAQDVGTGQATTTPFATPRTKRGKSSLVRVLATVAVAVVVGLFGAGVLSWSRTGNPTSPPPGPAVAMTSLDDTSMVTATVRLTTAAGGTKVELACSYSTAATRPYTFRLMAYGPDEQEEQLGSWQASPGAEFSMEAATHFTRDSLARLELVRYDGKALLAYDVP